MALRAAILALHFLAAVAMWGQSEPASQQIVVRDVELNGATQLSASEQQQIIREIGKKPYDVVSFRYVNARLRDALQDRGFYKAKVLKSTVTLVSGSDSNGTVDVSFDIHEGQLYHLKRIDFTNNHVIPPDQLRRSFPISDGDIFSTASARSGFEALRRLYVDKGYIDFVPLPEVVVDEPQGLVTLEVDTDEGVPFRVGVLMINGTEPVPGAAARLREAWKQYEGGTYFGDLLSNFIRENAAYLPPNATGARVFRIYVNDDAHVLDFRLELDDAPTNEPTLKK